MALTHHLFSDFGHQSCGNIRVVHLFYVIDNGPIGRVLCYQTEDCFRSPNHTDQWVLTLAHNQFGIRLFCTQNTVTVKAVEIVNPGCL